MKFFLSRSASTVGKPGRQSRAGVRVGVLVLILLCLGLGAMSLWVYLATQKRADAEYHAPSGQAQGLSEATRAVLKRLDSPVEIRFYSLLTRARFRYLQAFSRRVDELLSDYQHEGGGILKLTRIVATPAASRAAAFADGIRAFNLDKGDGCYLGLTVESNGRKESLARLMPEWEPAVESDVSRAIVRVSEASSPVPATASPSATDLVVIEEVKRALPNFASVSVKEGSEQLRESALKEFTAAVKEMQGQLNDAQQRLAQAQNGGSETEQQDAMKNLQQLQAAQTEKLKQITARSRAQIDAFEKMKATGR